MRGLTSLYGHSRPAQYKFCFNPFRIFFLASAISNVFLFLQIQILPESWLHFNTNRSGRIEKSMSSKSSHTPKVGIIYFSPSFSATIFLTAILSTIWVYSFLRLYIFSHCNFSLNVHGLSQCIFLSRTRRYNKLK